MADHGFVVVLMLDGAMLGRGLLHLTSIGNPERSGCTGRDEPRHLNNLRLKSRYILCRASVDDEMN